MLGERKSARGIDTIPLETIFMEEGRDLFIKGEITTESADAFCEQFIYLLRKSNEPIRVWISSPGGSVPDGLRIYDMISSVHDIPIHTIAYGPAYSMAGVLLASGTKGYRIMFPHTRLMLHPASYTGGYGGNLKDMQAKSEMLREYEDITNQILSRHSGRPIEQIVSENSFDHFYTAKQAIECGFCDREAVLEDLI